MESDMIGTHNHHMNMEMNNNVHQNMNNNIDDDQTEATTKMHPIELEGGEASFPAMDEYRAGMAPTPLTPRQRMKRGLYFFLIGLVLFLLIVIAPAVAVSRRRDRSSRSSEAANRPRNTMAAVVDYLVKEGISSRADLENPSSPRYQTAQWMAETDPANLILPSSDITLTSGYNYMARYVMALNHFALDGPNWPFQKEWLSELDICYWHDLIAEEGIFCFRETPPGLTIAPGLPVYLHMNRDTIKGTIPEENGKLSTLLTFSMQINALTGSIPTELCGLTNLETLALSFNQLTGSIPDCLTSLSDMTKLYLHHNTLTGSIPTSMGLLDWNEFTVHSNLLDGLIPTSFEASTNMDVFLLYDNMFTGDPTTVFSNLPAIRLMMASDNQFTGVIDESFMANKPANLWLLDLSSNNFTSPQGIPAHLFDFPKMGALDLSNNNLAGELPSNIAVNSQLQYISLFANELQGELPIGLTNLNVLDHLDLSSNNFGGTILEEIGNITTMRFLFLSENNFERGPIPESFAQLGALAELSLRDTQRTGTLPAYIGNFSRLDLLDLGDNEFTGTIPDRYGQLVLLDYLLLNNNTISDAIPSSFANLKSLKAVYLDGTSISGNLGFLCEIPSFMEASSESSIYANCGGDTPQVECSCNSCKCCTASIDDGCSRPSLSNLDGSLKNMFRRPNSFYEFGNETVIDNDDLAATE